MGEPVLNEKPPGSHWGQALHPLERITRVRAGKKVTVLAKRDATSVSGSQGSTDCLPLRSSCGDWLTCAEVLQRPPADFC